MCVLQVDDAAARRGDIAATCYLNASLTVSSSIMIHRYAHVDRNREQGTGQRDSKRNWEKGKYIWRAIECVANASPWSPSGLQVATAAKSVDKQH